VRALRDASLTLYAGKVACLLGDNGAGKSTLIKILAGVEAPDSGSIRIRGELTSLRSPSDALDHCIAAVFQDLAMVLVMPVYRNFVLGREPTRGHLPFRRLDGKRARSVAYDELRRFGLMERDVRRPVASLSRGQRQAVAIGKAIHYGAEVLVLDEPTSALGLRQAATVLQYIGDAKERGLAILFITHNVHHAFPVGDSFTTLTRDEVTGEFQRGEIAIGDLTMLMASGEDVREMPGQSGGSTDSAG